MKKPEENEKPGVEGWIDERIQTALAGLALPFEKRIGHLRERVRRLQARVQQISCRVDDDPSNGRAGTNHSGEGEP
jgi:hypothetical protein